MKLIVGLGNPGTKYAKTRHNIGFVAVDELAKKMKLEFSFSKNHNTIYAKTEGLELIKPQTFMNNSGVAVRAIAKKHQILPQDILIVMDDLDMEVGKIRYRDEGSSGGHRGLQSIIDHLGTSEIPRLKIGIGRPIAVEPDQYVLNKFTPEQSSKIKTALPAAIELINGKFLCSK
ncbi:MAG: aminoacyl-tRNA hydrolase [Patescibacteria group bacterium]